MSAFGQLGIKREFAPGLEPGLIDSLPLRISEVSVPFDVLLLGAALLLPIAIGGVAAARLGRRRRPADTGLHAPAARVAAALAALRSARMAADRGVRHLDDER